MHTHAYTYTLTHSYTHMIILATYSVTLTHTHAYIHTNKPDEITLMGSFQQLLSIFNNPVLPAQERNSWKHE